MKPSRECIRCIASIRLGEVIESIRDVERSLHIQIMLLERIAEEFKREDELTIIASNIFKWLTEVAPEIIDYYRKVKKDSIDRALKNIHLFREHLGKLKGLERFRFAVKTSIAGNLLDTGVHGHTPPSSIGLDYVVKSRLVIDHTPMLYKELVNGGKRVVWLFDNAGEAVYDTILIDLIRSYGNEVIGIAKGEPGFQNDLTVTDALYAGIDEHLDKLVSTGCSCSSIHLDMVSREVINAINNSDLVISKGMANYEYLSEIDIGKPIAFLLIPKCRVVASTLGVERNSFVAYYR